MSTLSPVNCRTPGLGNDTRTRKLQEAPHQRLWALYCQWESKKSIQYNRHKLSILQTTTKPIAGGKPSPKSSREGLDIFTRDSLYWASVGASAPLFLLDKPNSDVSEVMRWSLGFGETTSERWATNWEPLASESRGRKGTAYGTNPSALQKLGIPGSP